MGRNAYAVVLAGVISLCLAEVSFGQLPVAPPVGGGGGGPGHGRISRPMSPGLERWRQMQPDERLRFRSNAERWLQMPPEEQRFLREREQMRRENARREAEAALRQSGLQLEAERRAQYERQYLQERRRIEQQLREELQERRRRELAPVVERLRKEFGEQQGNSAASAAPSASGSAKQPK